MCVFLDETTRKKCEAFRTAVFFWYLKNHQSVQPKGRIRRGGHTKNGVRRLMKDERPIRCLAKKRRMVQLVDKVQKFVLTIFCERCVLFLSDESPKYDLSNRSHFKKIRSHLEHDVIFHVCVVLIQYCLKLVSELPHSTFPSGLITSISRTCTVIVQKFPVLVVRSKDARVHGSNIGSSQQASPVKVLCISPTKRASLINNLLLWRCRKVNVNFVAQLV